MVFDARCLPILYWDTNLKGFIGLDSKVVEFLGSQTEVQAMYDDIKNYLERWLPKFSANNRSYLIVAISCTGGQHCSVYLCEKLK